jgi:type II secretory pathway component PulM
MIKNKFLLLLKNDKLASQLSGIQARLQPVLAYYTRLSERERHLLMIGGALIGLMLAFSLISSAINLQTSLQEQYLKTEQYRLDAKVMAKQYKGLSQITNNEFSQVSRDRIKGDMKEVLDISDPQVILADDNLKIDVPNASFESVMLFLDQLRKSYGLFPTTLNITRLTQSGYVAISATFPLPE